MKEAEPNKVLLWGAKSKGLIAQNMLSRQGKAISYIYDPYVTEPDFPTTARFSNRRSDLGLFIEQATEFIIAIGGENGYVRHHLARRLVSMGLNPIDLVSSFSYQDPSATVGSGFQAMPGSVLHCNSIVGDNCILNCNCCVDHECRLGNGVHVMGSAAIAGKVTIGDYATIGTNATILPNIQIGAGAFVGAGAVVLRDVADFEVVVGNPARFLRMHDMKRTLDEF